MNIFCIAGGNFYSFYINYLFRIKQCDLLIFNFGIFDSFDRKNKISTDSSIKEVEQISNHLNCPVLAGVMLKSKHNIYPAILSFYRDQWLIRFAKHGIKLKIKNKTFIIGVSNTDFKNFNKIVLSDVRIYPNINNCSSKKTYIFCDKFGVNIIYKKKLTRKFHKCSKIILK